MSFLTLLFSDRKLKRLNLGGNELTSVPQRSLSIFDNLKKLEIQENKIRSIKEGDFEGKNIKRPIISNAPFSKCRVTRCQVHCNCDILTNLFIFILFASPHVTSRHRYEKFGFVDFGAQSTQQSASQRFQPFATVKFTGTGG